MPARDVLWDLGMTLPTERMNDLKCRLRHGAPIPKLVSPNASIDQITDAVWKYTGTLKPDPTWGYQLGGPDDLWRMKSVLDRSGVHFIQYNPQGLYGSPWIETMMQIFLCQLGPLPEDSEYKSNATADPDSWDWGPEGGVKTFDTRRIYRWRVSVTWRETRPQVKVEQLMQLQKAAWKGGEYGWHIFNKGGQNQLYTYQPNEQKWWSGADVGDWLETHAVDIAYAIEAVAWALISAMTLGAGAVAAASVAVVKTAATLLRDGAVAAATGRPFDFTALIQGLGSIAASLVQIPGVSQFLGKLAHWAQKAGETALKTFLSNGVVSSILTSGGGILTNLTAYGAKVYEQVKGWIVVGEHAIKTMGLIDNITKIDQVRAVINSAAPRIVGQTLDGALNKLSAQLAPENAVRLGKELLYGARDDLVGRLDVVRKEVKAVHDFLPAHLHPWFDFGAAGRLSPDAAPFYATAAVQAGEQAALVQAAVENQMTTALKGVDARMALLTAIEQRHLITRYPLLEYVTKIAPRYAGR